MKKILLFLFLLIILSYLVNAGIEDYTIYYGALTLQSSNVAAGQTLTVTIGGVASGSATISTAGEYKLIVTCTLTSSSCDGVAITFSLSTPSGYTSVNDLTGQTYARVNNGKYVNLSLSFSGTATTTTAAAAGAAAAGGGGGAISSAPSAPSETITKVTDLTTVSNVIASLPEGWVNVEVYRVGTPTTEAVKEISVENALKHVTETEAISVLQNIQNKLESKEIRQISVTKTLNVYKITNKDTGENAYRSEITLTFTPSKDMKNVEIIEVVPKTTAQSSDELHFPGIKPNILQKDPVLQWLFDTVKKKKTGKKTIPANNCQGCYRNHDNYCYSFSWLSNLLSTSKKKRGKEKEVNNRGEIMDKKNIILTLIVILVVFIVFSAFRPGTTTAV